MRYSKEGLELSSILMSMGMRPKDFEPHYEYVRWLIKNGRSQRRVNMAIDKLAGLVSDDFQEAIYVFLKDNCYAEPRI